MDTGSPDSTDLRCVDHRVTASYLAVFTAFAASTPLARVDAVVSAMPERLGDGSAPTVCNLLRTSTELGLVRRIGRARLTSLYELPIGDSYHHSVCRCCDAIADDDSGYESDEAAVTDPGQFPGVSWRLLSRPAT